MKLKDILDAELMVLGSPLDGKVPNLFDMNPTSARRLGYLDENDCMTDRGYNRATSADYAKLSGGGSEPK